MPAPSCSRERSRSESSRRVIPARAASTCTCARAFGPRAAFLYGWQALLVMDPGIAAAIALGAADYIAVLLPATSGHEKAVALAMLWVLAAANMTGLRLGARLLNALTAIKVAALAGDRDAWRFSSAGGSAAHFVPFFARRPGAPPLGQALGLGLVAVLFSFGGFWEASRVAGEVRRPERTLPRALALGVAVVTARVRGDDGGVSLSRARRERRRTPPSSPGARARRCSAGAVRPCSPPSWSLSVVVSALALLPHGAAPLRGDGSGRALPARRSPPRTPGGAPARATAVLAAIASLLVLSGGSPPDRDVLPVSGPRLRRPLRGGDLRRSTTGSPPGPSRCPAIRRRRSSFFSFSPSCSRCDRRRPGRSARVAGFALTARGPSRL